MTVDWTQSSTGGVGPQSITFTNTSTPTAGTTLTSYLWEYSDDGGGSWTAFSNQASPTYTFLCEGCYKIRLTVFDSANNFQTRTKP